MEERGADFLRAVRQGYLRYAEARPNQTTLLNVSGMDAEAVENAIRQDLEALLA